MISSKYNGFYELVNLKSDSTPSYGIIVYVIYKMKTNVYLVKYIALECISYFLLNFFFLSKPTSLKTLRLKNVDLHDSLKVPYRFGQKTREGKRGLQVWNLKLPIYIIVIYVKLFF